MTKIAAAFALLALGISVAEAQTVLPDVQVTAPYETRHGGYVVSSNFTVDPKISEVVYPKEPLEKDDIVWVKTQNMRDDEYFVLQECSREDCTMGHIVRVWTHGGAIGTSHDPYRLFIPHEGKFFMFMQRIPMLGHAPNMPTTFSGYEAYSPPLIFNPTGTAEQFMFADLKGAQDRGPEKVVDTEHNGMDYLVRYESGTSIFIQRMRAE